MKAFDKEEIRFSKTITYTSGNMAIKSHRNIENRQITDRTLFVDRVNHGRLKWTDTVLETGKNLETTLATEILTKAVFSVEKLKMDEPEVLNLFKAKQ